MPRVRHSPIRRSPKQADTANDGFPKTSFRYTEAWQFPLFSCSCKTLANLGSQKQMKRNGHGRRRRRRRRRQRAWQREVEADFEEMSPEEEEEEEEEEEV